MRRFSLYAICILIAVIALALVFPGPSQAGKFKKEYKMTLVVTPGYYWGQGALKFAELVNEKTNGRINIKPYWRSQLLKGAQLKSVQMVANGAIDCGMESTINIAPVIAEANIFSLPFFINSFENLDKMENGQTGRAVFAAMEKKGLKGLAWAENGFRQITNSTRPIRTPADVKGLKLRVVGSPIFIDIFRQLGADPITMNWADAVSAFQQGAVDGLENPVGVLLPVKIWQYHKYATFWNYLVDPVVLYWNKKQWDKFPKDIQAAILEAAQQAARFEKALCRAGQDGDKSINILKNEFNHTMKIPQPIRYMEARGTQVTFLSDDERNAFIEATRPLYEKWVLKIGTDLYEKAQADMGQ